MIFCRSLEDYWEVVLKGLGSKVAMTAVMLWLVVGMYGAILKSGHIVEGLVWLSVKLGLSGAVFTVCAFVFAAMFAVATGSGFGTISTMCFILYPAGILLGCNPAVLAGAILSGAAFGDNCAPVSDTTIIAATSQEYKYIDGTASIGGAVKSRYKYVLIAAINTIANICVSPFINAIGKNNDIHPYRRANILATTICSFPFFLPYGGCVLLLLGGINGQKDVYSFLPSLSAAQIIPTAFYCWAIWGVMLVSCLTGRGRAFEGENGEYIVSKTNPHKVAKQ